MKEDLIIDGGLFCDIPEEVEKEMREYERNHKK